MSFGTIEHGLQLAAYPGWSGTLTYGFYSGTLPAFYNALATPFKDSVSGLKPLYSDVFDAAGFSTSEQAIVARAAALVGAVANLSITKAADSNTANIHFGGLTNNSSDAGAYASPGNQTITSDKAGDIWFYAGSRLAANPSFPGAGGHGDYTYSTVAHELGHAIGLQHTFTTPGSPLAGWSASEDSMQYSIMSYTPIHARAVFEYQLYDIAALQKLYGPSTVGAGTTVYNTFSEHNPGDGVSEYRIFSIWDSGGAHDKIDASGQSDAAFLDLRPGHFSSVGPGTGVVLTGHNVSNAGVENVSIAFGAYIEDAAGTAKSDVIIGNAFANLLDGGAGDDFVLSSGAAAQAAAKALGSLGLIDLDEGDYRHVIKGGIAAAPGDAKDSNPVVDDLRGGDGNDTLVGDTGDDKLDGGSGDKDMAVYGSNAIDYDIVHHRDTDTWTISNVRGEKTDGSDTLTGLELAQFGDQKFQLKANGISDQTDLALVIDTTGSMGPYIDAVKAAADSIIDSAFKGGQQDTHVGIVSFKDPTQGDPNAVLLSFTTDIDLSVRQQTAINAINAITVGGGGDIPETDNAGLLLALDGHMGEWRDSAAIRRIVLFTDAPVKDTDLASQVATLAHNLGFDSGTHRMSVGGGGSFYSATLTDSDSGEDAFGLQIFTIALNEVAVADMTAIANATNGKTFTAADGDTLVKELFEIINLPSGGGPVIDSNGGGGGASVTVFEGESKVARVHATDDTPGAVITYSIAGGADADRFSIDGDTGVLRFKHTVDFEHPVDSDGDNIYDVIVGASDGALSAEQDLTVSIRNIKSEILGSAAAETLVGTAGADLILAKAGNDTVWGLAGNDRVEAAGGDDLVYGGEGNDLLRGGIGNDRVHGGAGNDKVIGEDGNDRLWGDAGDDTISGGNGNDTVLGGAGHNLISGDNGDDIVIAGAGGSRLNGGAGNDTLKGGVDGDVIAGGTGRDTMTGGGGGDTFLFNTHMGRDVITDFGTDDVVSLSASLDIADFADLQGHMSQVAQGTLIVFDDLDTILLLHVQMSTLTGDQFHIG